MSGSVREFESPNSDHSQVRKAEPGVLASSATGIVNWIERYHGDVDRIFGHAGISPEMAGSPTLVSGAEVFLPFVRGKRTPHAQ